MAAMRPKSGGPPARPTRPMALNMRTSPAPGVHSTISRAGTAAIYETGVAKKFTTPLETVFQSGFARGSALRDALLQFCGQLGDVAVVLLQEGGKFIALGDGDRHATDQDVGDHIFARSILPYPERDRHRCACRCGAADLCIHDHVVGRARLRPADG